MLEENCNRPDCAARRERLEECRSENDHLRVQLKTIENRLIGSKNKLSIVERTIAIAEEKNERLRGLIDDSQARISSLEVEVREVSSKTKLNFIICENCVLHQVGRGENMNEALRHKLAALQKEIETFKQQTEEHNNVMQNVSSKSIQEVVFAPKSDMQDNSLAAEVSVLRFDDDSEEERF